MADSTDPATEALRLAEEFPPVTTADWEAVIQADLKGADYEKKLVWKTEEGIAVRPYYRREHLRLSHRSHHVITKGGDQPNVVPRNVSLWFYLREID